ncbi:hypothetical protein E4U53_002407, partial [Claviceps sorghi]
PATTRRSLVRQTPGPKSKMGPRHSNAQEAALATKHDRRRILHCCRRLHRHPRPDGCVPQGRPVRQLGATRRHSQGRASPGGRQAAPFLPADARLPEPNLRLERPHGRCAPCGCARPDAREWHQPRCLFRLDGGQGPCRAPAVLARESHRDSPGKKSPGGRHV